VPNISFLSFVSFPVQVFLKHLNISRSKKNSPRYHNKWGGEGAAVAQLGQTLCYKLEFYENPFSGSRVVPCGWKDRRTCMTKLIVTFRNFANALKIIIFSFLFFF